MLNRLCLCSVDGARAWVTAHLLTTRLTGHLKPITEAVMPAHTASSLQPMDQGGVPSLTSEETHSVRLQLPQTAIPLVGLGKGH